MYSIYKNHKSIVIFTKRVSEENSLKNASRSISKRQKSYKTSVLQLQHDGLRQGSKEAQNLVEQLLGNKIFALCQKPPHKFLLIAKEKCAFTVERSGSASSVIQRQQDTLH